METAPQRIATLISRQIVNKVYPVGSRLPTERELALEFKVTRHVIREALKRLEAVGLVRIRQGSGIYVQNLPLTGGVELFDVLLTHEDGSLNMDFLRAVLEFRGDMYRAVVRLAAVRHTDEELEAIRLCVRERKTLRNASEQLEEVSERLFQSIITAAHNPVYQLLFNTLGHIPIQIGRLIDIPLLGFDETQTLLERIIEVFEHRDRDMVDLLMSRFLDTVERSLMERKNSIINVVALTEAGHKISHEPQETIE